MKIQVVADRIKKAGKDFSKHDQARKNADYKNKRLQELEADWKEYVDLDEKLAAEIGEQPSLVEMKTEVENTYATYKAKLLLIPENEDNSQQNHHDQERVKFVQEEVRKFLASQLVRTTGINRILDELEDLMFKSEELSKSYCTIKKNSLNSYWERILLKNEEFGEYELPEYYEQEILELEKRYERALIFIENQQEINSKPNESIKLPRVEIPKFEGDYFAWINFKEIFTSMIIDNKSLSEAQRMQMLKTSVVKNSEAELLI